MAVVVCPSLKDDFYETDGFVKSVESSEILHRATATAAFHNSKERFDPPKCHPKTRVAILTEIMKWVKWEGDLDSFIMWVYGPAGGGKSAIAQTIAEMCEREMLLLASFFFSRNDPSRSTVDPLIATLAYQITLNLPDTREAIFGAIERDPLIFKKSLAVQVESLIIGPLQRLVDAGFFNDSTSRRLIIIDGLDECFDPKVQQHIVEVLANSQQQRQLPLIFLITSRPEQDISFAFSNGFLRGVTTRIALDDSYLPDDDIELFLTDKFQEIKSTHPRRACIPPQWPLPYVLKQLVIKSSGQFIYASTVIRYITSSRHKPTDRLDIILGIRPPQRDLPFSELDALYTQILAGVEDIERVLEILSCVLLTGGQTSDEIEKFLSLQPGDVELYLWDLHSLINHDPDPDQPIHVLHASLTDFLVDPTRSKTLWINPRARHTASARRCLQILQLKGEQDYSS